MGEKTHGKGPIPMELLLSPERMKYIRLLAESYPTPQAAYTEIINLSAILNLPKGTEHFISDLHGEYDACCHILNNCSGVIREKVEVIFDGVLGKGEQSDLCTLIYYPKEKLHLVKSSGRATPDWYRNTLQNLIELSKVLSSKYTRSKVRKAMPQEFSYIIDELLHAQADEDNNQQVYHEKIIDTILSTAAGDDFIVALAALIKRLAVDHLHVLGDIFDRGAHPDKIMDLIVSHHSLDIQWGNHDMLWMGAAAGNEACMMALLRNNLNYGNTEVLENGYGIGLRSLTLFAQKVYGGPDPEEAVMRAVRVMLFKLEGQLIMRHPEYHMEDRLLLDKIDFEKGTVHTEDRDWEMKELEFPTLDPEDPYALSPEEERVVADLKAAFLNSERLHRHVAFLYAHGSIYRCFNQNLLFHGCIPLDQDGNFAAVEIQGRLYQGRAYMDMADAMARRAWGRGADQYAVDFMWYLWGGELSPLCGRKVKTFERSYIKDQEAWVEPENAYYRFCRTEQTGAMILREFGLYAPNSHIINGHRPVKVVKGESPVKAGGKVIVIDGGFCRAYHKSTGIAGYTLIYNSRGMRIKAHRPFESVEKALKENKDIDSDTEVFETEGTRVRVKDSDNGKQIAERIADLEMLLVAYRSGLVTPAPKKR